MEMAPVKNKGPTRRKGSDWKITGYPVGIVMTASSLNQTIRILERYGPAGCHKKVREWDRMSTEWRYFSPKTIQFRSLVYVPEEIYFGLTSYVLQLLNLHPTDKVVARTRSMVSKILKPHRPRFLDFHAKRMREEGFSPGGLMLFDVPPPTDIGNDDVPF